MMTQCGFTHLHLCLNKINISFWTLREFCFLFYSYCHGSNHCILYQTYSLPEDLSNLIYHARSVSIYFLTKQMSTESLERWLNIKHIYAWYYYHSNMTAIRQNDVKQSKQSPQKASILNSDLLLKKDIWIMYMDYVHIFYYTIIINNT